MLLSQPSLNRWLENRGFMEKLIKLEVEPKVFLSARQWVTTSNPSYVVVGFHGMVSHSKWFTGLGDAIAREGGALIVADRRGSGESRSVPLITDPNVAMNDMRKVLEAARKVSDDITLFLWCGGAVYGLPLASEKNVNRIFCAAPGVALTADVTMRMNRPANSEGMFEIPFDPVMDFSADSSVRHFIANDKLRLVSQPAKMRALDRAMVELAKNALAGLPPVTCVLASNDKIVDNKSCRQMFKGTFSEMAGGHAVVLENPSHLATLIRDSRLIGLKRTA